MACPHPPGLLEAGVRHLTGASAASEVVDGGLILVEPSRRARAAGT